MNYHLFIYTRVYLPLFCLFQKYMWSLLVPLWKMFDSDNQELVKAEQLKHAEAVQWTCGLGLPDCVHLARSLYAQWMQTPKDMK